MRLRDRLAEPDGAEGALGGTDVAPATFAGLRLRDGAAPTVRTAFDRTGE